MSVVASPAAIRRWGLLLGTVLVLPQLVLAVVVVRQPLVVGLVGFAFTIGVIRFAAVGYRELETRSPWTRRGARFALGAVALIAGALLHAGASEAAAAAADPGFDGAVAPLPVIALNLVVLATLALWIAGAAFAAGSLIGLVSRR